MPEELFLLPDGIDPREDPLAVVELFLDWHYPPEHVRLEPLEDGTWAALAKGGVQFKSPRRARGLDILEPPGAGTTN